MLIKKAGAISRLFFIGFWYKWKIMQEKQREIAFLDIIIIKQSLFCNFDLFKIHKVKIMLVKYLTINSFVI